MVNVGFGVNSCRQACGILWLSWKSMMVRSIPANRWPPNTTLITKHDRAFMSSGKSNFCTLPLWAINCVRSSWNGSVRGMDRSIPNVNGKKSHGTFTMGKTGKLEHPQWSQIKSCLPSMGMKRNGMTLVFSVTQVLSRLNIPGFLRWRWLGANEEIPCASLCALNIIELWRYCDKTWNLKMLLMWCRWIPQQKPCKFPRFQRSL